MFTNDAPERPLVFSTAAGYEKFLMKGDFVFFVDILKRVKIRWL